MSLVKIIINTPKNSGDVDALLRLQNDAANSPDQVSRIANFLQGVAIRGGNVLCETGGVRASVVGTFTGAPTAADTVTINGVDFTARAANPAANEFVLSSVAATNATRLAAAINASTSNKIKGTVIAVADGATVTVYATDPGQGGNMFTCAESMTNFAWAGAATALSGGTNPNTLNQINVGRTIAA